MSTCRTLLSRVSVLAFGLLATGCGPGQQESVDRPARPPAGWTAPQSLQQRPLTAAEREQFYHLAEGSELVPVAWVKALRNPFDRSKFFLENPERFGLISDPGNPDRLPIGATADYTVDTRFLRVRMLGFNCAACHVTEITYQGSRLRIDGAPGRFNGDSLNAELRRAIHQTLQPAHLIQFIIDLVRESPPPAGSKTEMLRDTRHPAARSWMAGLVDDQVTPADRAPLAALDRELRADEAQNPAVDLHEVSFDSTSPEFQQLMQRYSEARLEGARTRVLQALPPDAQGALFRTPEHTAAIHGSLEEILSLARMLRDRLRLLSSLAGGNGSGSGDSTRDGPGRVDAFGVARNRLYRHSPVPTDAPVSFPHLWGFGRVPWLHYDANTNSVMERNLGQALGVGGVFDRRTMRSTLNPVNIHRLEQLARTIPEPTWPAFFPPIDQAKAAQGEPLFGRFCAGCHVDQPQQDVCFPLAIIGTDPRRANNFAAPLGRGRFTDSVAPLLHRMKDVSYVTFGVPRERWLEMNGGMTNDQVVWRVTDTYGVRNLRGVWATAPYLHNGSVPNLYELLLPVDQRSRSFPVGHSEYDPVRVGYSMNAPAGTPRFDTSQRGNGNGGHEYGSTLTEPERMALLEYLKTLGAYSGPVTPQSGAVTCPSLR